MYVPAHFEETRLDVLHGLIREHPLGTLVTLASTGLSANHIPFELDTTTDSPNGVLRGHVARANPVWRDFAKDTGALVVFQGPELYVSPNWYPSKAETGKVVPTWNYAVVHASGPLVIIEDKAWLRSLVGRLTDRHETSEPQPWQVADAPADYIETLLGHIVGVEIPIAQLTGKWKVSQNRIRADRDGVANRLAMSALVKPG